MKDRKVEFVSVECVSGYADITIQLRHEDEVHVIRTEHGVFFEWNDNKHDELVNNVVNSFVNNLEELLFTVPFLMTFDLVNYENKVKIDPGYGSYRSEILSDFVMIAHELNDYL